MRCPSCGKQTPGQGAYCLNCGAPLASRAGAPGAIGWENDDFIYHFPKGMWAKLGSGAYSEAGAKLEFWQNCQRDIYAKLKSWEDDGWEPVSPVDSGCVEITTTTGHRDKSAVYWIFIFLISLETFGLLFILIYFLSKSTFAEPVRAVIPMRRPKQLGSSSPHMISASPLMPSLAAPKLLPSPQPSQAMRLCPRCAHSNRVTAKFCSRCGQTM